MKNREIILFLFLLAGKNGKNVQVEGHVDYKRSLGLNSCTNYRGMHRILADFPGFSFILEPFLRPEMANHHQIKNVIQNIIKDELHMKMLKNADQIHFGSRCHHLCPRI